MSDDLMKTLKEINELKKIAKNNKKKKLSKNVPRNICDFIEHISPGQFDRPVWLQPLIDQLNYIIENPNIPVKFALSVPPQHGKSTTILYFIALYLYLYPKRKVIYCTYNDKFSQKQIAETKDIISKLGIQLEKDTAAQTILEESRGTLLASSFGSSLTGHAADLIIVDDPHKNFQEAMSANKRDAIINSFKADLQSRASAACSTIVISTRWHVNDLIGYLVNQSSSKGFWKYVNIPALDEYNNPLAPASIAPILAMGTEGGKGLEFLAQKRLDLGETEFNCLFQGIPKDRGGTAFSIKPKYYKPSEVLKEYKTIYGVDMAYSERASADFAILSKLRYENNSTGSMTRFQIPHIWRNKGITIKDFCNLMKQQQLIEPGPIYWYWGGQEHYAIQLINNENVPNFFPMRAKPGASKIIRAQRFIVAWNNGKISLPENHDNQIAWIEPFLDELDAFTGEGQSKMHDDQIDALAAAFDGCDLNFCSSDDSNDFYNEIKGFVSNRPDTDDNFDWNARWR